MFVLLSEVCVGWISFQEVLCCGWFLVLDLGLHLETSLLSLPVR